MADENRLAFLKEAGLSAWKGLRALLDGVDVVIDPNEPPAAPADGPGAEGAEATPPPEPVGTIIGRRAMAAAEHRPGTAVRSETGSAMSREELLEGAPLTLAAYPGPAVELLQAALALPASPLEADGELEWAAIAHDLAWLPLELGHQYFGRLPGSKLLAVGGYRRAALVQLGDGGPFRQVWCALGDEMLARLLPPDQRPQLLMERPEKLVAALGRLAGGWALLGGASLEDALRRPNAAAVLELNQAGDMVPVWGLFSGGRDLACAPVQSEHFAIAGVAQVPGLAAWMEAALP